MASHIRNEMGAIQKIRSMECFKQWHGSPCHCARYFRCIGTLVETILF